MSDPLPQMLIGPSHDGGHHMPDGSVLYGHNTADIAAAAWQSYMINLLLDIDHKLNGLFATIKAKGKHP